MVCDAVSDAVVGESFYLLSMLSCSSSSSSSFSVLPGPGGRIRQADKARYFERIAAREEKLKEEARATAVAFSELEEQRDKCVRERQARNKRETGGEWETSECTPSQPSAL